MSEISNVAGQIAEKVQEYITTESIKYKRWRGGGQKKYVEFSSSDPPSFYDMTPTFVFICPNLINKYVERLITTLRKYNLTCGFNSADENIYRYEHVIVIDPNNEYSELCDELKEANIRVDQLTSKENLKDNLIQALSTQ